MSSVFRGKQLSPKTIRLRSSFDSLVQKSFFGQEKAQNGFNKINFSMGKPYKFPEYQDATDTCYSPSSYENPLKKNKFRIQKIEKLENILLQKNYKFKKACNTSYKSQKTQRFQKTMVAFQDLQQIESLNIRKFKQESEEMIRLKQAKKIHELLDNKRLSQTIYMRRTSVQTKTPRKLKQNIKRPYFEQTPYNTLSFSTKHGHKNLQTIDYLNKTSSYFDRKEQSQRIEAWNVSPQMEIGMTQVKIKHF